MVYNCYPYKIGDKIRKKGLNMAEYEIIGIQEYSSSWSKLNHYRIKNLSIGCRDHPNWFSSSVIYKFYEPCSAAMRLLYDRGSPATHPPTAMLPIEVPGGLDGD